MSESFESVRWIGMHVWTDKTLIYTLIWSFWGMESEPMLTSREKSPLPKAQRRVILVTLHRAEQQNQHTTELFRPCCTAVIT